MSIREDFEAYKALTRKSEKIKQNHKNYYIISVELFLDYLKKNDVEDIPKGENFRVL